MDTLTKQYRNSEFGSLDRDFSEYKPSIKVWDAKGNSTKTISITADELNQIIGFLTR